MAGFSRAAFAAAAALLAGCATTAPPAINVEGSHWRVALINGTATPATDAYRLQFDPGRVGGRFGCNQFGGPYRIERQTLIVGGVAATRMGCPEPAASFENQGFAILREPMGMAWASPERLVLSNATGSIALERIP